MKKLTILGLFIFALISLNSCKTEDDVVFTATPSELSFTNSFSSEYVLTTQAANNIGERFTWQTPTTEVPTNFTYDLQYSVIGDFTDTQVAGSTTGNDIAITIGDMLGYASQIGIDGDAATEDIPNTGDIYFRLRSYAGTTGELESFTATQTLTLVQPESGEALPVCDLDQLWLVGAGVTFADWSWDTPQKVTCTGTGVYSGNIAFTSDGDANFRFFTVATDWGTGQNFPFFISEGYTIDPLFEENTDDDMNFKFLGDSGLYLLTVDAINKTITLGDPAPLGVCDLDQYWAVGAGLPDAGWSWDTPVQLMCEGTGVYQGWVNYTAEGDANFRFFTVGTDWGSGQNFPFFVDAGYTIDPKLEENMDDDLNFKFIGETGKYFTIIDTTNKTITLE